MGKRSKGNKGYTLVELMVVLVIMGILIGVGIAGITGYVRYAHFKKNNEYAQTIYSAAQTSFTQAKASGKLTELEASMKEAPYSLENAFRLDMIQNGVIAGENRSESDRLYYFIFDKTEDSDAYQGAKKVVFDMVASYVYDASILDATFCVEFDPVEGIILGVCYDDDAEQFSYTSGDGKSVDNISDRAVSARKPQLLGYYGADILSARTPESVGKNTIKSCELINDETLHLKWNLQPKAEKRASELGYEVKLFDADDEAQEQSLVSITIQPGSIQAKTGTNKSELNITCDVTVTKNGETTELKGEKFSAYAENNMLYLDLDAVDLSVAGETSVTVDTTVKEAQYSFRNSYSIQRFGITSQQNVTAKVRTITKQGAKGHWSNMTNSQNAMFGNEKLSSADAYQVANARHLFNIRYVEKNADVNQAVTYSQTADFNWSGEESILSHQNVYSAQSPAIQEDMTYSFQAITSLKATHTYDGNEKVIGGLVILPITNQKD